VVSHRLRGTQSLKQGIIKISMGRQLLYSEQEYARVKWYIVSSGKDGTIDDIMCVTRHGYLKAGQIQEQLHNEGLLDLNEIREFDE